MAILLRRVWSIQTSHDTLRDSPNAVPNLEVVCVCIMCLCKTRQGIFLTALTRFVQAKVVQGLSQSNKKIVVFTILLYLSMCS